MRVRQHGCRFRINSYYCLALAGLRPAGSGFPVLAGLLPPDSVFPDVTSLLPVGSGIPASCFPVKPNICVPSLVSFPCLACSEFGSVVTRFRLIRFFYSFICSEWNNTDR